MSPRVVAWFVVLGATVAAPVDSPSPSRIITISPNGAEVICALDACDRIVGVDKFCVYPPELAARPRVGGLFDPDLEKIVTLRPDLVVLRGRNRALEELCGRQSIPLYLDRTERLADIETCILELGHKLGCHDRADGLVREFHQRLEAIRGRTADKPRPRALLTISRRPDAIANVMTAGKRTFLDEMLEIAGGTNVFGHLDMAYPQISPEAILAQQPEVILEFAPELNLTNDLKQQMIEQWTKLGSIPAVANRRIYFITDDNALIPSPRYVEIIEKIVVILRDQGIEHPPP